MKETREKSNLKEQKAITLIALVITIIVLLILAAVSIATLTGQNGILTQANNAKTESDIAGVKEQAQLDIANWTAEKLKNGEDATLNDAIVKSIIENANKDNTNKYYSELTETSIKTKQGNEILFSDLYTKTGGGKTISDLYDENNNWEDTGNYNEDAMHIGDYVNYTAGSWTETKEPPSSTPFTFGGYTSGQSRDTNASGSYTYTEGDVTYGEGKYEGWRIWDISEDKQTITLISAGCPEVYYHPFGANYAYISEYILTGNINTEAESLELGLGSTYVAKDWSMYKNTSLYATNARAMQKSDLDTWYGKYINSDITDSWNIDSFPLNTDNKLIGTIENGFYYWLSSASRSSAGMYYGARYDGYDGRYVRRDYDGDIAFGVRVLVTLTSDVRFNETPKKVEQDGFSYNKWIIESK